MDRGIYVVGDKSWSIDMQRYNFQFTGQRFYRIEGGKLAGQLRDVAYQATTTDFWGSLDGLGGRVHLAARRGLELRQGAAGAGRAGQPRLPVRAVPRGQRAEHGAGGRPVIGSTEIGPQELVERVLEAPKAPDCVGRVVIVTESSTAVLRWANSTMTTNGHSTSLAWSVISLVELPDGTGAGVVSSSVTVTDTAQVADAVRESEQIARDAGPARDAAPLPDPTGDDPEWSDKAAETSIGVFTSLAGAAGRGVRQRPRGRAAAVRLRQPRAGNHLARHVDRRAPAVGAADRIGRAEREAGPGIRRGRECPLRTSPTWTSAALAADLAVRLELGAASARAAGRSVRR